MRNTLLQSGDIALRVAAVHFRRQGSSLIVYVCILHPTSWANLGISFHTRTVEISKDYIQIDSNHADVPTRTVSGYCMPVFYTMRVYKWIVSPQRTLGDSCLTPWGGDGSISITPLYTRTSGNISRGLAAQVGGNELAEHLLRSIAITRGSDVIAT